MSSCSDDDSADSAAIAVLSDYDAPAAKTDVQVQVSANGTWILDSNASWAVPSAKSGNGNTLVVVSLSSNSSSSSRTATLSLRSGSASAVCQITQSGVVGSDENLNANYASGSDSASIADLCMPAIDGSNTLVVHYAQVNGSEAMNYALEWNNEMKHAQWVAFYFDAYNCAKNVTRSNDFQVDPLLPSSMQIDNSYHTSDGFDRGHLCASYDRAYSSETNLQTFYFSNMSPQLNSFNAGVWQTLESLIQRWGLKVASGAYDKVYVAKGGTLNRLLKNFDSETGVDGQVALTDADGFTVKGLPCPEYYFAAVLVEKGGEFQAIGFALPHTFGVRDSYSSADIKPYAMSIDDLEEFTGIDFFCNLNDVQEGSVESSFDLSLWDWTIAS